MAMGIFKRALIGAGAGGAMGAMSEEGSFLGGAAGGALAAGPGMALAGRMGKGFLAKRGGDLAGGLQWGMGKAGALGGRMMDYGAGKYAAGKFGALGKGALLGGGYMQAGARTASGLIGQNAAQVNKWGGRALAGLGVASGAYIGSSMISSNRGF